MFFFANSALSRYLKMTTFLFLPLLSLAQSHIQNYKNIFEPGYFAA